MGQQDDTGIFSSRITEQADVEAVLRLGKELGVDELDTARVYLGGNTEIALGQAGSCKQFTVATKVFPAPAGMLGDGVEGFAPKSVKQQVQTSLTALQTDCIDLLYLHWPDPNTHLEETLKAINDLHKQGKFRNLGLSNYPAYQIVEIWNDCRTNGYVLPSVAQYPYNPLARTAEAELLPVCRRYGLALFAYNPLAGGLLAGEWSSAAETVLYEFNILSLGKYHQPDEEPDEGRFSNASGGIQAVRYRQRYWNNQMFEALRLIRAAADAHGLTMAGATLRWMAHHSMMSEAAGDALIIGCSSQQQLRESLEGLKGGPLPAEVAEAFDSAHGLVTGSEPYYSRTGGQVGVWSRL